MLHKGFLPTQQPAWQMHLSLSQSAAVSISAGNLESPNWLNNRTTTTTGQFPPNTDTNFLWVFFDSIKPDPFNLALDHHTGLYTAIPWRPLLVYYPTPTLRSKCLELPQQAVLFCKGGPTCHTSARRNCIIVSVVWLFKAFPIKN